MSLTNEELVKVRELIADGTGTFEEGEKITYSLKYALNLTTKDPASAAGFEFLSAPRIFPSSIPNKDLIKINEGDINSDGKDSNDNLVDITAPYDTVKQYKIIDPITNKVSNKNVNDILGTSFSSIASVWSNKAEEIPDAATFSTGTVYRHWFHDYNTSPYNEVLEPANNWKGIRLAYKRATVGGIVQEGHADFVPHISLYLGVPLKAIPDSSWAGGTGDSISYEHAKDKGRYLLGLLGLSNTFKTRILKNDYTTIKIDTASANEGDTWFTNPSYGLLSLYGIKDTKESGSAGIGDSAGTNTPRISFCRYIGGTATFSGGSSVTVGGVGEDAPTNGAKGDLFYDIDDPKLQINKDGTSNGWVKVGGESWTENESDIYRSSHNVGIGTENPKAKLNVAGKLNDTNNTIPSNYGGNSTTTCVLGQGKDTGGDDYWGLNIGTIWNGASYLQACHTGGTYNLLLNPKGHNVGIGTENPKAKLNVAGKLNDTNNTIPSNYGGNSTTTCVLGHGRDDQDGDDYWGLNIGTLWSGLSYIQGCHINGSSFYDLLLNPKGGNVGISNESPDYKLDINIGTEPVRIKGSGSGTTQLILDSDYDNYWSEFRTSHNWDTYKSSTDTYTSSSAGTTMFLNYYSAGDVSICGGGGGNVGIGTDSPGYKLQVDGDIYANGGWVRVSGDKGLFFETHGGGWYMTDSTYIRNYNSKQVSLNNTLTAPTVKVGDMTMELSNEINSTSALYLGFRDAKDVRICAAGGKVGCGVWMPICPLHVGQSSSYQTNDTGISSLSDMDSVSYLSVSTTQVQNASFFDFANTGTGYNLSIYAEGMIYTTTYVGASDIRIKKDITEIDDERSLVQLRNLPCVDYNYIDPFKNGEYKTIGFIAQDVKEIMPNCISMVSDIIPNVMRLLENFEWVEDVSGNVPSNKFKLITNELEECSYRFIVGDISQNEQRIEVAYPFIFDKKWDQVFVYGKRVDDFLAIDKHKIFAVAFSATQEIDRIQQAEKTKLEEQTSKLEEHITKLTVAETKLAVAETKLAVAETKLAVAETKLAVAEAKITELEAENSTLNVDIAAIKAHLGL